MKLYGFPPSPNTWKVRAVAAHLGLRPDFEFVDLTRGQSRIAEFLALNPTGRTPVLVDGDFTLWESNAIMQYLASRTPNALWPNEARIRADIMRWQSWQLAHWSKEGCEPLLFERLVKKIMNLGAPDPAVVAKGTENFHREARVLDAHLAKQSYLVGKELPLAPYPHIRDWFERVSALPAWRETAPPAVAAAA
jgi:glutathione S-transferase